MFGHGFGLISSQLHQLISEPLNDVPEKKSNHRWRSEKCSSKVDYRFTFLRYDQTQNTPPPPLFPYSSTYHHIHHYNTSSRCFSLSNQITHKLKYPKYHICPSDFEPKSIPKLHQSRNILCKSFQENYQVEDETNESYEEDEDTDIE